MNKLPEPIPLNVCWALKAKYNQQALDNVLEGLAQLCPVQGMWLAARPITVMYIPSANIRLQENGAVQLDAVWICDALALPASIEGDRWAREPWVDFTLDQPPSETLRNLADQITKLAQEAEDQWNWIS